MVHPVYVRLLCGNAIVREGLSRILTDNQFQVAQYSTIAAALHSPQDDEPRDEGSLLIVDVSMCEQNEGSFASLRQHFPTSYLVLLADNFDFDLMLQAFQQGAMSYIIKEISCDRLVGTLRLVAIGERVLPPQLVDALEPRLQGADTGGAERPADAACLSDREFQILRWLIVGHPNKIISQRMEISEATVKVHVKSVLRKLNVQNRTQAAIWAANHGVRGNGSGRGGQVAGTRDDVSPQLPMFRMLRR